VKPKSPPALAACSSVVAADTVPIITTSVRLPGGSGGYELVEGGMAVFHTRVITCQAYS